MRQAALVSTSIIELLMRSFVQLASLASQIQTNKLIWLKAQEKKNEQKRNLSRNRNESMIGIGDILSSSQASP